MNVQSTPLRHILTLGLLALLLSGCTSNTDRRDADGFAPHLTVDLKVTAPAEAGTEVPLSVEVKKSGQPLAQADKAEFVIWPESHPDQAVTVPASQQSPGLYAARYAFSAEGLYIVQSRVAAADLEAMPAKRIAIGPAAVEQLAQLEHPDQKDGAAASGGEHHH
ncbi:FixH family protein [Paenibacillus athensensis]|nr:FixH family protein [Paenibacillus athensensis]MCD1261849.1 FixH family protein [Paenibacillus athensensis]